MHLLSSNSGAELMTVRIHTNSSIGRASGFGPGGCGLKSAISPGSDMRSHSSSSLPRPRCKIGTWPWLGKPGLTLKIYYVQVTESTGDGASTLPLKTLGRVNQTPKQRAPVAPQNVTLSPQRLKKMEYNSY